MGVQFHKNIVTSGLIFQLDTANIRSYVSGSSTINDISLNGYNGTLSGSTLPTYQSGNGGSLYFNGSSHINIPHQSGLNLTTFTFTAWLKNTSASLNWDRVVSKKYEYTGTDGWEISLATGTNQTIYIGGSSSSFGTVANVTNWTANAWHYLVVVFLGNYAKVYCDGNYIGQSTPGAFATPVNNSRALILGRNIGPGEVGTEWRGNISFVSMYNRELSQAEVTQNFSVLRGRFGI